MVTIVKRNICLPDGKVVVEDVSIDDVLPAQCMVNVAINFISSGLVEGFVWVEEQYISKYPRWATFLLCMFIKPSIEKHLFVRLSKEDGTEIEFSVSFDPSKNIQENIMASEYSSSIHDVWILRS